MSQTIQFVAVTATTPVAVVTLITQRLLSMKIATHNSRIGQQLKKNWHLLPTPLMLVILSVLLLAVLLVSVSFGSTPIPISTIARILLNGTHLFHFTQHWDPTAEVIVWQVRMPVVIGAAL